MSDTPRTDETLFDPVRFHDMGGSSLGDMRACPDGDWVEAERCREIERELNATLSSVKELKAAIWPVNSAVLGDSSNWIYESPKFNPAHKIVIQITIGEARAIRNAMNNIKS